MNFYHITVSLFVITAYFIITDQSIAISFLYLVRKSKIYIKSQWWWILNNPRNPIVKYIIHRRSLKMADQMISEINSNKESDTNHV